MLFSSSSILSFLSSFNDFSKGCDIFVSHDFLSLGRKIRPLLKFEKINQEGKKNFSNIIQEHSGMEMQDGADTTFPGENILGGFFVEKAQG